MKINLNIQMENMLTLPVMPVGIYTGSALPLEIVGIPAMMAGGVVSGVSVTVTNADGIPVTGAAAAVGGTWMILFAASNFANYGDVMAGIRIDATVDRSDGTTAVVTVGVADLNIKAASADATPGTPSNMVMVKGGDIYCKSQMVGGVQHYVKQVISHDPEIGWGADWTGDYVLGSDGQYVEVT